MNKLIEFKNVVKRYDVGEKSFNALDGISKRMEAIQAYSEKM